MLENRKTKMYDILRRQIENNNKIEYLVIAN